MKSQPMSSGRLLVMVAVLVTLWVAQSAVLGGSVLLQGQSKGGSVWLSGNLQDWQELAAVVQVFALNFMLWKGWAPISAEKRPPFLIPLKA